MSTRQKAPTDKQLWAFMARRKVCIIPHAGGEVMGLKVESPWIAMFNGPLENGGVVFAGALTPRKAVVALYEPCPSSGRPDQEPA